MARRFVRGTRFFCDRCPAEYVSAQPRALMPPGWVRVTMRFTQDRGYVEESLHWDLCPGCATLVDKALARPESDLFDSVLGDGGVQGGLDLDGEVPLQDGDQAGQPGDIAAEEGGGLHRRPSLTFSHYFTSSKKLLTAARSRTSGAGGSVFRMRLP